MARYHLYLGTYTQKGGTGIEHYAFDSKTGGFALLDATPAPNPSYLCLSPDGQMLYACLEAPLYEGAGGVAAFRRNRDGSLQEVGRKSAGGVAPCPRAGTSLGQNAVCGQLWVRFIDSV